MIIVINKSAGEVAVDGVVRTVDLSKVDADINYIKYDDVKGVGVITYINSKPKSIFGAARYAVFSQYHQAWKTAGAIANRSLEDVKKDKRQQINSMRDTLEKAGFPYLNKMIDSDPISVARITSVVQVAQVALAASQSFEIDWTTKDNSVLTLDAAGVLGMPVALVTFANELHEHARDKKAQIESAQSIEDVELIAW